MADPKRVREVAVEAFQETERLKAGERVEAIRIRLRRDDPRVQNLLRVVEAVAVEVSRPSGVVERRVAIEDASARVLAALRACGVPIDDLLQRAGLDRASDPMGAFRVGLGFLGPFAAAFGGKTRDAVKVVEDEIRRAAEA